MSPNKLKKSRLVAGGSVKATLGVSAFLFEVLNTMITRKRLRWFFPRAC